MTHARLRWQCRRGMRELDVLLSHWLEHHYLAAADPHKSVFEALLALSDPELAGYLLQGREAGSEEARNVIEQIRRQDAPGDVDTTAGC